MTQEKVIEVRVPAHASRLRLVRTLVEDAALQAGCGIEVATGIVIAVNEACMNIIQHAYKGDDSREIVIDILNNDNDLVIRLVDFAAPTDPASIKSRDLNELRPGGLGMHFIYELMDDCEFGRLEDDRGNCLEMRKRIA